MSWTKIQPFSFKLLIAFLFQGTFIKEKQLLKEVRKIKQKNFGKKKSVKKDQLKIEENVEQPQYIAMFHFSISVYNFSFPHSFQHFLIPCDFSHLIFLLFTLPSFTFSILTVLAPSYSYCYLSYRKIVFAHILKGLLKKRKRQKA